MVGRKVLKILKEVILFPIELMTGLVTAIRSLMKKPKVTTLVILVCLLITLMAGWVIFNLPGT
ncbi:Phage protein [Brevibacillus aydinogluensis]|uniref:Phage protein n=1 Tax=Brevibacillus aydinogluensis TaxID=927786 RepID=A0AA48RHU5_9BACL|nr:Phage protein [Brevibacillus aydinogluensis]